MRSTAWEDGERRGVDAERAVRRRMTADARLRVIFDMAAC